MVAGTPIDIIEALSLLHLQHQEISNINCEQLVNLYAEIYREIGMAYIKKDKEHAFKMPGTGTKF